MRGKRESAIFGQQCYPQDHDVDGRDGVAYCYDDRSLTFKILRMVLCSAGFLLDDEQNNEVQKIHIA